ncbi:hypothetical protein SLEP1_g34186 [Rubroshorea leprosula]|uniref:Uncharacterized protein n=2 Tax=Rubroshorea leprosula TaxID=152421 RepID=A0AAV5KJ24_9ROSI|nr:hypothetical protein SLEP1_g34186 [Rubroshorea leprosula]
MSRRQWKRERLQYQGEMETLRTMEVAVAAMKVETKSMKQSQKKEKAKLRELEVECSRLRAERRRALESSAMIQVCSDTMYAMLFSQANGDFALVDHPPKFSP